METINITKLAYKSVIPTYGIYTLLFILENLEKEESYEECAQIRDAINEYCKEYNIADFSQRYPEPLETRYRKEMSKLTGKKYEDIFTFDTINDRAIEAMIAVDSFRNNLTNGL